MNNECGGHMGACNGRQPVRRTDGQRRRIPAAPGTAGQGGSAVVLRVRARACCPEWKMCRGTRPGTLVKGRFTCPSRLSCAPGQGPLLVLRDWTPFGLLLS
ncbi:hypothetical protein BRADI_2g14002v3 [Brachypodium distachyon]|uniref:Uncharacterized protein n=1 Tax=Brachypodium distachyon TaxID=15368 RepID=A0A2K2D8J5_BRADI|nr:hypothetical protein BRADI_2g14002v3 [Brachypodium distachyon]